MFDPALLFDLKSVSHAHIFDGVKHVWEVLPRIKAYLEDRLKPGHEDAKIMEGVYIDTDNVFIGPGTVVETGAFIRGPAIIGRDCQIRQGAYIRGNALVGDGCVVGHVTELKNSVMLDGSKAGHFAYIGDSILGREVNLGAGTKLANLKINNSEVVIRHDGERYETGLRKFGAILGDECELGCNSVTAPGTIIGARTLVYPNASPFGVIASDSIVKLKQKLDTIARRSN